MSNSEKHIQDTQRAFLVAWGWFAEHFGLIQQLQALCLKQKHDHHGPQSKVLELLVAVTKTRDSPLLRHKLTYK